MRRLLLIIFIAAQSFAAIARTGNCAASSGSCTFSATATGDLKVVWVGSISATIPTLPAGWTSITTFTIGSSGTIRSFQAACNVSSSSGDTGSGSWTSGAFILGVSYSGTGATSTANCATAGVGGFASDGAQTSTTLNYDAITMADSSGASWVAGFGHESAAAVPAAPTGMTSVNTATGSPGGERVSDTNAGVTSWALKTVTVTSSTWISFVAEIKVPGSGANRHRAQVIQ